MAKKYQIVGFDMPCVDFAVNVEKFPKPNGGCNIDQSSWQGGGKVPTALVAAARLGAKCAFIGAVGDDDYGKFTIADFKRHDVNTDNIIVRENSSTSLSLVLSNRETMGRSIIYKTGTAKTPDFDEIDKKVLEECDWYFIVNHEDGIFFKLAEYAKNHGAKTIIDADSYSDELMENLHLIDAFVASEFVYDELFKDKNYEENCKSIFEKGCEIVVFTFGEKGSVGYSKDGFFNVPAIDIKAVDTVGAGDVFHGAFAYCIAHGMSAKESAEHSTIVAGIKCLRVGGRAGIPNLETVNHYQKTGKIMDEEIIERVNFYEKGLQL